MDVHELTAGYALDALEPAERERYEAHLGSCEHCRDELEGFWEVSGALGRLELEGAVRQEGGAWWRGGGGATPVERRPRCCTSRTLLGTRKPYSHRRLTHGGGRRRPAGGREGPRRTRKQGRKRTSNRTYPRDSYRGG